MYSRFAKLLNSMGRADEARTYHLEAIEVARQVYREYGKIAFYGSGLGASLRSYFRDAKTQQQKDEAAELIDELIAEFPESADLHRARAEWLSGLDAAEAKLTAAIEEYPRQADYYLQRAKVFDSQGALEKALADYEKVLADYEKAIEVDPNILLSSFYPFYQNQNQVVRLLCAAGQTGEAEKSAREYLDLLQSLEGEIATQLNEHQPTGYYWQVMDRVRFTLADILKMNGRQAEARELWGQALDQRPDGFLDYKIRVRTPGTYRLHVRWDGHDYGSDSFHARIVELSDGPDDSVADWYQYEGCDNDSDFATGPWQGSASFEGSRGYRTPDEPAVWSISTPGEYTIRLSHCESGAALDVFVFQLVGLPAPNGEGPEESQRNDEKTFLETAGRVAVEAEHFSSRGQGVGDDRSWRIIPTEDPGNVPRSNFRGSGYVQFIPDIGGATGGHHRAPLPSEYRLRQALQRYSRYVEVSPDSEWYSARARVYLGLNESDKALADYSKALSLDPDEARFWFGRGSLHAEQDQYEEAAADYAKAIELGAASYYTWYQYALFCLATQDREGYGKACTDMLQQFAESSNTSELNFAAWSCVLAPDAVDDYSPAIDLAERAVKAESNLANQGCLGAVLHRAGRFEEAIETLQSVAESEEPGNMSPAYGWYFLAMAHHAAGDSEKANQWLNKAVEWTDGVLEKQEKDGGARLSWNRRLTLNLLRAEAEALLDGGDTDEPSTDQEEAPRG